MKTFILCLSFSFLFSFALFGNNPEAPSLIDACIDMVEVNSIDNECASTTLVPNHICCENFEVSSEFVGVDAFGCCEYRINVANKSDCPIYVIDQFGNVSGPITATLYYHFPKVCNGQSRTFYISPTTDVNDACWSETFTCETPPNCCDDVSVGSIDKGIASNGCCEHEIEFKNEGDCDFYLIDQNGNAIGPISSSNYSWTFYTCNTQSKTYYVSPTTDMADACWSETFTCDEEPDCCEDFTVVATDKGIASNGCCEHVIDVSNTGDCDFYLIDQNGNALGPISTANYSWTFYTCNTQTKTYSVSPTPNVADACWTQTFSCDEEPDCCVDIAVEASYLGTAANGCCEHSIQVDNNSGCDFYFIDQNGNAIGPISSTNYTLSFFTCNSQTRTMSVSPTPNIADACWTQTFTCLDECCVDVDVQSQYLGLNSKGCCRYRIITDNSSDCDLVIFDENGFVYATVPAGAIHGLIFQVCGDKERTFFVGTDTNAATACWSETFDCDSGNGPAIMEDAETRLNNDDMDELQFLNIAPNPFVDQLQFNLLSEMTGDYTIRILDLNGNVVNSSKGNLELGENNIAIEGLTDLPSQLYFIYFESGQQTIYKRVVKE